MLDRHPRRVTELHRLLRQRERPEMSAWDATTAAAVAMTTMG
jgi:hypothetical protein